MNRILCYLVLVSAFLIPSLARSQAPDIRSIRPAVMLLIDTSGSMQYRSGSTSGVLPVCSGSTSGVNDRSRWATVLEALTGSWSSYTCTSDTRRAYAGAPDQYYPLPHFVVPASGQQSDGILDTYLSRVKFGLMTYDNVFGVVRVGDPDTYRYMVPRTVFEAAGFDASFNRLISGDFSYGTPRVLGFPGCAGQYIVDAGARNTGASAGALIAFSSDSPVSGQSAEDINAQIQAQLLGARPYGATPTAALLDDLRYFLQNDPSVRSGAGGDPLAACRSRYSILITDGQPSDPYRDSMNCASSGPTCPAGGCSCPYETPASIAADLCRFSSALGSCTGSLGGLYVVGFDVGDPVAQAALNDLASLGGTGRALIASDRLALMSALSVALDVAAPGTTTRTSPSYATGVQGSGSGNQFVFNSGFQLPASSAPSGTPWSGVLDRTRYVCDASLVPQRQALDASQDSFHTILNSRNLTTSPRVLYTVATSTPAQMSGVITGLSEDLAPIVSLPSVGPPIGPGCRSGSSTGTTPTTVSRLSLTQFSTTNSALTPDHFNVPSGGTTSARVSLKNDIINWVHGQVGTARATNRFGDIYHSNPVVVGPPRSDLADESYNLFRRRPDVSTRPTVVYVGTNDGVLHAFAAEAITLPSGRSISSGEEIWGFIPPAVVPRIRASMSGRQELLDGTPVVRDVFFRRLPGDAPTASSSSPGSYRTVLVMGMRAGGNSYFALDVTDPINPTFLWQFTSANMGQTYARPAVGQFLVDIDGTLQERAMALLPGGRGTADDVLTASSTSCAPQGAGPAPVSVNTTTSRTSQRCWSCTGRSLHWIDIATGRIVQSLDSRILNAPLMGGISLFPGDTGTVTTRAFLTDADGVIWRVDTSNPRYNSLSSGWTAAPFHDIFWDASSRSGIVGMEPPVISTDGNGQVVILQATGNSDVFDDGTVLNRVVSLTERLSYAIVGGTSVSIPTSVLNWEIRLRPGELVTGPMDLYSGNAYFGSFEATSGTDACQYGQSRVWGVNYTAGSSTVPVGYTSLILDRFPRPALESTSGSGVYDAHFMGPYLNQMVMGVSVTQQVACVSGTDVFDPYVGRGFNVTGTGGGAFQLTAQISGANGAGIPGATTVQTMTRTLPSPVAYTRVYAWVPQADL